VSGDAEALRHQLEAVVAQHNRGALASYLAYLDEGGTEETPSAAARRRA